jgi:two-component system, chemotaxis family, protein-glutamate methylesterase/glutaminase
MAKKHKTSATSTDSLRRGREQPERTGRPTEEPIGNLIVIGASAGGYTALRELVQDLSDNIPAAIIILLHASVRIHFQGHKFSDWLRESTRVPVYLIQSGDRLCSPCIYVVPPAMAAALEDRTLKLVPYDQGTGPVTTINLLFKSAAQKFRDRVIGVILTGLLKDGTEGLRAVHNAGGITIVQDPQEADYPQMPASALQDLPVTFCLKLADIGPTLDLLARRKTELETGLAVSVRLLKERVALLARLIAQSKRNPETHQFLSAEMIQLELELRSIQALLKS